MIAIMTRDLNIALRSGGGFGLGLAFFLITILLVAFAIGPNPQLLSPIAPGIFWVAALLSCLLTLDRIFTNDFEDGSLSHIATAPVPLEMVVLAKAITHWLTTALPLVVAAPLLGPLLQLPNAGYTWLAVSLALGTPALSIIGSFGAALTVGLRRGGVLLSLLVLPLYVPTLIFGAELARLGIDARPTFTTMSLLAGISLGCLGLLPIASAAVLRVNLR